MDERPKKLLLVEDQALIAMTQKMHLAKVGYEVDHVLTGEAAVTAALACESPPDLILMDIDLGTGIDGTQAAEQILTQRDVPIVFLSSHTDPRVVEKTEKITSYGYVVKNSGFTVLDTSIKMAFKLFEANQQRAKNEEEYRRLFDTMPTGVVHQLPDGTITSVNPAAERILGPGLTKMIGAQSRASLWNMIDEDGSEVPDYKDPVMMAFTTGESVGPVERGVFVPEKNAYTWLKITATPLFNPGEDSPYQSYASLEDITAQKHAERESNRRDLLVQKILDTSVDLISIVDLNGVFQFVSASHDILGYDPDDLIGAASIDFVHPDDRASLNDIFARIVDFQEQRTGEYRYRTSAGEYLWFETTGTVLTRDNGTPEQILFNTRDITERKRMEEMLRRREQYYRSIYNSLRDAIIVVDENRKIVDCNAAFTELFGYHLSDVHGVPTAFLYGSQAEEKQLGRMMREHTEDTAFMFQPRYRTRAGEVFPGEKKVQLLKDEHGIEKGFVGVIRDITERKQAEEEVQRQLAEKELLLQEVHHRIKNNMAQVESMLSLQAASTDAPEVHSALKEASSRVRSIRALYEKLLVGSDYADVSMNEYLESLVDLLKEVYDERSAITLRRTIENFSLASKDAISVGIIVNELLTNTFKYAFRGSSGGQVFVSLTRTGTQAALVISDDGLGLDRSSPATESSGFGLTIVTMLAEHLGGTFTMECDNGTTSTVTFDVT